MNLRDGLEAVWHRPDGRRYEPGPPKVKSAVGAQTGVELVDSS